jgi:hypothetical protein
MIDQEEAAFWAANLGSAPRKDNETERLTGISTKTGLSLGQWYGV